MTFDALPDRTLVRTRGGSRRYVRLLIEAPAALESRPRPLLNLAVVVDRSGSMHGDKIERARDAARQAVRKLRDGDRLSVIAYDDRIDLLLPSVAVEAAARRAAEDAISRLEARGTTNLCEGWLRGCEQAGHHLEADRLARALLLSDGLANQGITSAQEIASHAAALRERGVSTSTFGIGEDFDEVLLARMAEAGGGNFYYVESAAQIPGFVASEVGESLDVVARDASIVVRAPEGVAVRSLNGYTVSGSRGHWRVGLGALVSRQQLEPVIELLFPPRSRGETATIDLSLNDADGSLDATPVSLTFRYASDQKNDLQPRDVEVDREVARLFAASAGREALRLNRDGRYDAARKTMLACARHIAGYAGDDPKLNEALKGVQEGTKRFGWKMPEITRKRAYSDSLYAMKMRGARGRSLRAGAQGSLILQPLLPETFRLVEDVVFRTRTPLLGLLSRVDVSRRLLEWFEDRERSGAELSVVEENTLVQAARAAAGRADVCIVTTCRQLEDNWFSHWHAAGRTAISSLFGWDRTAAVAVGAFVAYEILLYGLNVASSGYDPTEFAHEDTRGCLFDFCGLRPDIEIVLQTMDLCPTCEGRLRQLRVDVPAVREICDAVRELARPIDAGSGHRPEQRPGV